MAKKRKLEITKSITVRKYPFDPDNNETYELSPDEIVWLERGSYGKAKAWKNPSQFVIDQLQEQLIAYGCREDTLKRYTIPDIVEAIRQGFKRTLKNEFTVVWAEVCEKWEGRYLEIATDPKQLEHWHKREKNIINRLIQANDENLKQGQKPLAEDVRIWLSEIWPFGEHCKRLYTLPADLDAIYLAVGLRLDTLFKAENLVTEGMLIAIVHEWRYADKLEQSRGSVLFCFGPWFNGEIITYDNPLELFWGYIEADLRAHGFDKNKINQSWPGKGYTAAKDIQAKYDLPRSTAQYWWDSEKTKLPDDMKKNGPHNQVAFKDDWIKEAAKKRQYPLRNG